jgi:P4 family phage/plasmid primase-like protien
MDMNDIIPENKVKKTKKQTNQMPISTTTKTLSAFLRENSIKKEDGDNKESTNTRIGSKDLSIYGGKYHIPDEKQEEFLTLYAKEINNGTTEYITEKQLETEGAILIDVDLRFDYNVKDRKYTEEHLEELRNLYLEELKNIYQFDEQPFYMYVFEKSKVNQVEEKQITKDGIHIIIGVQSKRDEQLYLRNKVISKMDEIWGGDLKDALRNSWEEVFDLGITTGSTGWQLYGSTKPGYESYKLTKMYKIDFDDADQDFIVSEEKVPNVLTVDLLKKLSARCKNHPRYFNRGDFINAIESMGGSKTKKTGSISNGNHNRTIKSQIDYNDILHIKTHEELSEHIRAFLEDLESRDYEMRETYDYTMALPEKYYGEGSFANWLRVGWALRNISDRMLIVWVQFSAKWDKFKFSDIRDDLLDRWMNFDICKSGLTRRSIMHWLKMDNPERYNEIRMKSIEYYINETLKNPTCGHVDIAKVLFEFYKDQYVCTSLKGNIWYNFRDHRWKHDELGTSLRERISSELRPLYSKLAMDKKQKGMTMSDDEKEKIAPIITKIQEVIKKLGHTGEKDSIMKEAKEQFYDRGGEFIQKLDTNPYILCFTNGVIDFKEKVFRVGRPEDCVSKCTGLKYVEIDENIEKCTKQQIKIMDEINDFMHKLFPVKELHDYMWEHLASVLIGKSNQTFHMYIGKGRNGKSALMDLMGKALGEYKGDVPLSIITAGRSRPGGLTPELVELKGIRFAPMQEPSPDEKINVGPFKMLTGGTDVIQCRAPYMTETLRYFPQFKLCLCTNTLMKINSLDDGTWRRIRVVEFVSLFTENPINGDAEKPYQFKVVENIEQKFNNWAEVFISMLVNIAMKTQGEVKPCDNVMKASNMYKGEQDLIGSFIRERITFTPNGKLHPTVLKEQFDRWYISMYDERTKPKTKDVFEYFDKNHGRRTGGQQPWKGMSITTYESTDADEDNEEDNDDEIFEKS